MANKQLSREEKQKAAIMTAVGDYLGSEDRSRNQVAAKNGAAQQSADEKRYGLAQSNPKDPEATLHPDCHLVMDRISPLVRKGGTLLATESEIASYAAMSRPDIKVIACEPDPIKFKALQEQIQKNGFKNITVLNEDPANVMNRMAENGTRVDAVSSFYGLNLKTDPEIKTFLEATGKLARTGSSVVIHDLSRPHRAETSVAMSEAFPSPKAPRSFALSYKNGLDSALTPQEAEQRFEKYVGGKGWEHEDGGPSFVYTSTLRGKYAPSEGPPSLKIPSAIAEYHKVYNDFNNAYAGAFPLGATRDALKVQGTQTEGMYGAGVQAGETLGKTISDIGNGLSGAGKWLENKLPTIFGSEADSSSEKGVAYHVRHDRSGVKASSNFTQPGP